MSIGTCANCSKQSYLMRLHGDKGGPLMCPICAGEWNAKHTRRRKFGRILAKAMQLYLENGGKPKDVQLILATAGMARLGFSLEASLDPLGYAADTIGMEVGDITSELLPDVLQLTHPDRHPPNLQDLAKRVTQDLLALKPFVFPAPKPKPAPAYTPPRDGSVKSRQATPKEPSQPAYPCDLCAETVPRFYCDPCKAEWRKRHEAERERERAKQREQYARRQQRKRSRRPPKLCAADECTAPVQAKRNDALYCSPACRQRAHRQRVADKLGTAAGTSLSCNAAEAAP
jgi:hypothetical protein